MKLALVLGGVALALCLSATTQLRADPACPTIVPTPYRSKLPYIPECQPVYCATEVDPEIKQGLHDVDIKLGDLNVQLSVAGVSLDKFKRACRAINGDLSIVGPRMVAFSNASYVVSVDKGKLADIYEALQQSNEASVFNKMRSSRMRTLLPTACMNAIDKQITDSLNGAQVLIDKIQINCEPSRRP